MENKIYYFEELNKRIKFGKSSHINDVLTTFKEFTQLLNLKDIVEDITVPHNFYIISVLREGKRCIRFYSNIIFSIKNYKEFHISERTQIKKLTLKIYAKFMRYMHSNHKVIQHSTFEIS